MGISIGLGIGVPRATFKTGLTPLTFNEGTEAVLVLDASGSGDEALEIRPNHFFEYDANTWGLLYMAKSSSSNDTRTIKLATSPKSGFVPETAIWTKQGTVLTRGSGQWDSQLASATVVKDGSTWILMYESFVNGQVGLATGTDLLSLTKHPSNPVINNNASSDFNKYMRHPVAIISGTDLYCMHEGRDGAPNLIEGSALGYAKCPLSDLTNWTISSTPLIDPTNIQYARGPFSNAANANIVEIDGIYYWWFQGYGNVTQNELSYGGTSYAYATNLEGPWTIVGTENYHIYMGLDGYNGSNDFYETWQEVTPVVVDGQTPAMYGWSVTSSGIGNITLDGSTFTNQFRGFSVDDNFNAGSIDTSKWTVDNTSSGISVTQSGGSLNIVADGLVNNSNFDTVFESVDSLNNDDGVVVFFVDLTVSDPQTGDIYVVEISNAARNYAVRLSRSTTTDMITFRILRNSTIIESEDVDFTGGTGKFKIIIKERSVFELWKADSTDTYFDPLLSFSPSGMTNRDWSIKAVTNNTIAAGGQTISFNQISFGRYDHGLVSYFET